MQASPSYIGQRNAAIDLSEILRQGSEIILDSASDLVLDKHRRWDLSDAQKD